MKKCPYCGEQIQDGAKKCRFCGERLEKKSEQKSKPKHVTEGEFNWHGFNKQWQRIFYILGWTLCVQPIFWIIMGLLYIIVDKKGPFFNENFYKRIYWRGLIVRGGIAVVFVLSVLFSSLSYMGS